MADVRFTRYFMLIRQEESFKVAFYDTNEEEQLADLNVI